MTQKKVTKSQVDIYRVPASHGEGWGNITVDSGDQSVSILADTDYGVFSHYWPNCGMEPKSFLCGLSFRSAMDKLTGGKVKVPDPSKYAREIKLSVLSAYQNESLTKKKAKQALSDMLGYLDEYAQGEILFYHLYNHDDFEAVFGDFEGMPSSTMVSPSAQSFWDDVWLPFIQSLKEEIDE
jgi:hypothetical protein